jgi:hypothetical protein
MIIHSEVPSISVLVDNLVDTYLQKKTRKDIWEALEAQYKASDAGGELYIMEYS